MTLDALQQAWDQAGKDDPMWSVLSYEGKRQNRWNLDEFLETGVREIEGIMADLKHLQLPAPRARALDFGCGPGRLSQALCAYVERVEGVDISPSMVELAVRLNRFPERCHYQVNGRDDLRIFPDRHFDFVYSNITLQHMEPGYARKYLREFARVLQPDGVLVFQIPSRQRGLMRALKRLLPGSWLKAYRRARYGEHPATEMHGSPRDEVLSLCREIGLRVVEARPDPEVGKGWESFRYYCQRTQP